MAPPDVVERADRAKQLYHERLQTTLEASCRESFVAIEPDSGDYFVAPSIDEAVAAARLAHPDRPPHVIRIGHKAAAYLLGARS